MSVERIYLLTAPGEGRQAGEWEGIPAHLAYQLGPGMGLRALHGGEEPRGGIMVIADSGCPPEGDGGLFCAGVERECAARGFRGVLLDFDRRMPPLAGLVGRLAPRLARRGITLFVPEYYAALAPRGKVLISSALSGGSLALRLEESVDRFGGERVVLAVERAAEDFTLPAPTGCGRPLSTGELEGLKGRLRPHIFFSRALCARYFTYRDGEGGVHFVLFDDLDTLGRKMEVARGAGVGMFLLPWGEIAADPGCLGLRRRGGKRP